MNARHLSVYQTWIRLQNSSMAIKSIWTLIKTSWLVQSIIPRCQLLTPLTLQFGILSPFIFGFKNWLYQPQIANLTIAHQFSLKMRREKNQILDDVLYSIQNGELQDLESLVRQSKLNLKQIDQGHSYPLLCLSAFIMDQNKAVPMFEYLIREGLDCKQVKNQISLPEICIQMDSFYIFKILMEKYGLKINYKTVKGQSLLHLGVSYNSRRIIQYLLQKNIEVNSQDNNKLTPLHHAIISKNLSLAKFLVKNGAEPSVRNLKDNSFIDDTVKSKLQKAVGFLKKDPKHEIVKYTLMRNGKEVKRSDVNKISDFCKFQQLLSNPKNMDQIQRSWQISYMKLINEILEHDFLSSLYPVFWKLYVKLHSNKFISKEHFTTEAKEIIKSCQELYSCQPRILEILTSYKESFI